MDPEGARLLTYSTIMPKPRLLPVHKHSSLLHRTSCCSNIHVYGCSLQQAAALHALRQQCSSEGSVSSFKLIT